MHLILRLFNVIYVRLLCLGVLDAYRCHSASNVRQDTIYVLLISNVWHVPRLVAKFVMRVILRYVLAVILCIFYHQINASTVGICYKDAFNVHPAPHVPYARQDTL